MKRNNKKGFTIVELVIVIGVIAILSAVMIPTFGGITTKAQESKRDQEARNLYTEYLATWDYVNDGDPDRSGVVIVDGHVYNVDGGQIETDGDQEIPDTTPSTHLICNNSECTSCHPVE